MSFDAELPSTDVTEIARLLVGEIEIEQIPQLASSQFESKDAVNRTADGTERVSLGVDGDAASDRRMVVARAMVDGVKILGCEKEVRLRQNHAAIGFDDAVEQVIVNDDLKKKYLSLANQVIRLYKAILPDTAANEFSPIKTCLAVLSDKIRNFTEEASIDDIMGQVGELLDESIATKGYVIHSTEETSLIDLSQTDFEALKEHFFKGRKRTEAKN